MTAPSLDVTDLVQRARAGDRGACDALFDALYPELRRIAHQRLAPHRRDGQLDTTALVHECYLKLAGAGRVSASDRAHFLAFAASAMRSIIVDAARARQADRRGGGVSHQTLDTHIGDSVAAPAGEDTIVDLDAALQQLARIDRRLVQVVEMRFFAGMTDAEIAGVLGVTDRTVRRDWEKARLLLSAALAA